MDVFPFVRQSFEKTSFRDSKIPDVLMPNLREGRLFIPPKLLEHAAEQAFRELAFYFRENHLSLLSEKLADLEKADTNTRSNDKFVIESIFANAVIAAQGELPLCQDTGTAVVYAWKDERISTNANDREMLEAGIKTAYAKNFLRFSQINAKTFFDENNTGNNLPAQIHVEAVYAEQAQPAYHFLFVAKGGGSTNKTAYFPSTPALLQHDAFESFLEEKIKALGTAGCPPYRLAVVAGGLSPEQNLEVLKLATTQVLDTVPFFDSGTQDSNAGFIHRDKYWEEKIIETGKRTGLGAQFGGENFILDARVLRLPRHAATFPVSIGVSCIAHRNIYAYIDKSGLHLENLVHDPQAFLAEKGIKNFLPRSTAAASRTALSITETNKEFITNTPCTSVSSVVNSSIEIDLNLPMKDICKKLSTFSVGDRVSLTGKLIVARDLAHLKWHQLIMQGKELPEYLNNQPVYYAGPAGNPPGKVIGSLGPTTAQRMDPYADELLSRGYSLLSLAKGNRTQQWMEACKKYGGFFLGTIGGAAALLAQHVTSNELIDYPELGMEAVRLISVKNLPAFVVIDDKGNDLYSTR